MSMLEVPGSFTMLVPNDRGWAVTRSGNTFEMTKSEAEGAVHISFYERDGSALGPDEVATLLDSFVAAADPRQRSEPRVLRESRGQHRAVTRFTTIDQDTTSAGLAFVILWRERFITCSCVAPPGSAMLDEAELMFASIFAPKKGFLRRR